MKDWTLGALLFWLAAAIFVPAIIVHFVLGRNGGHHLFEKNGLSKDEISNLPFDMLRKRTIWNLRGSVAAIAGLVVALALYPLGCLIGLPINIFGASDEELIFYTAGIIALIITLGSALCRKGHDK